MPLENKARYMPGRGYEVAHRHTSPHDYARDFWRHNDAELAAEKAADARLLARVGLKRYTAIKAAVAAARKNGVPL